MSDVPRLSNVLLIAKAVPPPSQDDACSTADLILHRAAARAVHAKANATAVAAPRAREPQGRRAAAVPRLGGAVLAMLCVFTLSALLALGGAIGR